MYSKDTLVVRIDTHRELKFEISSLFFNCVKYGR